MTLPHLFTIVGNLDTLKRVESLEFPLKVLRRTRRVRKVVWHFDRAIKANEKEIESAFNGEGVILCDYLNRFIKFLLKETNSIEATAEEQVSFVNQKRRQICIQYRLYSTKAVSDCPICKCEVPYTMLLKTDCGHTFCIRCTSRWKKMKADCPLCRKQDPQTHRLEPPKIMPEITTKCIEQVTSQAAMEIR